MSEQEMADAGGNSGADGEEQPEYRVSHLMDDLASAFTERDMVQLVAPLGRGGVKPRISNRVEFTVHGGDPSEDRECRENTREVLDAEGYEWTPGPDAGQFVVLGREIVDLRELRKGDRIHLNSRGGPFKVYRVMDHSPETLRRSDPAVTVELSNVDTETDWMLVHWKNEQNPVSYVKTKDTNSGVSGDFRYKKVEDVERMGRIGPYRLYAPGHDHISEGYQDTILEMVDTADGNGGLGTIHPMDLKRARNLMTKPAADVYAPRDAETVQTVMDAVSTYYETEADALAIESDEDRERAAENQANAEQAATLASAFNLANMDAVPDTEDAELWPCEDCNKAFTNKFKYPTHRRDCPARDSDD